MPTRRARKKRGRSPLLSLSLDKTLCSSAIRRINCPEGKAPFGPTVQGQRPHATSAPQGCARPRGGNCSEPRLAFDRTAVTRYRIALEQHPYAPSTINLRLAAIRRLAYEASDCGLLRQRTFLLHDWKCRSSFSWRYFVPEIYINLYEPRTLALALERTGFRPKFRGFSPRFTNIIRFKVLKNSQIRHIAWWEKAVPWQVVAGSLTNASE
jgi:hypothetical protein